MSAPEAPAVALSPLAASDEKLWRYADLARLWSWSLIVVAGLLLLLAIAIQAGSDGGASGRWFATLLGVTGLTGVLLFPLFRVWLRKAALPSVRLPQAVRATGAPAAGGQPARLAPLGRRRAGRSSWWAAPPCWCS